MPAFAWLEIPDFAVKICRRMVIWNFQVSVSNSTAYHLKGTAGLSAVWIPVFFFTILAAVDFLFLIGQEEDLVEFLLDGSNAARIPAGDDILDLLWKMQLLFLIDLVVLDDVDCDIVIDEAEDVEIQRFDRAFHLQDILLTHLAALRVFDDGNRAVELVELQVVVDLQAHTGFDMV